MIKNKRKLVTQVTATLALVATTDIMKANADASNIAIVNKPTNKQSRALTKQLKVN